VFNGDMAEVRSPAAAANILAQCTHITYEKLLDFFRIPLTFLIADKYNDSGFWHSVLLSAKANR